MTLLLQVPYHGIIADEALLRPHTTGMLSGYKNAWFLMGAAAVQFSVMMSVPVFSIYILQIISVPVFVGITIMSMRVKASHPSEPPFRLTLRSAIDSYKMTPASHGMMYWIILVYFIASAGLQWERYLYYFVRDCISPSQALAKVIASRAYLLCMVSSACACACYSALSHLTRTIGNCRLFITSLLLLAGGTALLIFVDTPWHFMCVCLLFGISSGLMLSAAFALAVENIPAGQQESLRCPAPPPAPHALAPCVLHARCACFTRTASLTPVQHVLVSNVRVWHGESLLARAAAGALRPQG